MSTSGDNDQSLFSGCGDLGHVSCSLSVG
jgi:hypothetical protein